MEWDREAQIDSDNSTRSDKGLVPSLSSKNETRVRERSQLPLNKSLH
jgi:hypothetical protein